MTFHDDWFAEPAKPGPARKHDAYTRRLVAWGWLRADGSLAWEPRSNIYTLLQDIYLPAIKREMARDLNRVFLGGADAWIFNPEAAVE